jgi:hypothetical protein
MDKLTNKKALLDRIRLSEGDGFECDEAAILETYDKQGEDKSSLAIKVLSIFGGFLATLTFLLFLGISGLYDSKIALLITGLVFIIAALSLNRIFDKLIIDTFSVSAYIIGLALFGFGMLEMDIHPNNTIILIGLIAMLSLFVTQNYILSFIAILTISGSFFMYITYNGFYNLIHLYIAVHVLMLTFVFLNESKLIHFSAKIAKLYHPMRIGLIVSLLFGLIAIGKKDLIPILPNYIWLSSIVMIFVILYLVHIIIKITKIESAEGKVLIYALTCLTLIPIVFAPFISGAIIIILLSFLVNYKTGLAIGVIVFIYFISQYYYDLNFTLLTKSIILFSSGITFLLFYLFTIKKLQSNEEI